MYYYYEQINELTGKLIALSDSVEVQDVTMQIDSSSAQKLAKILKSNEVKRENQDIYFTEIVVNANDLNIFTREQGRDILIDGSRNTVRFKGEMKSLVSGSDGKEYVFEITIGNIEFNLGDKIPKIINGVAFFENVSGTLFPSEDYQVTVI